MIRNGLLFVPILSLVKHLCTDDGNNRGALIFPGKFAAFDAHSRPGCGVWLGLGLVSGVMVSNSLYLSMLLLGLLD